MRIPHSPRRRGGPRAVAAATIAGAVVVGGAAIMGVAIWGNPPPPQPPAAAAHPHTSAHAGTPAPIPTPTPAATRNPDAVVGPVLPAADPTSVAIPAIGVNSTLLRLGLAADGTIEVPPLEGEQPAGWYTGSPTPGAVGPAVILGHVDTYAGRSVFYDLGNVRAGDEVDVARADGSTAVFTVDEIASYPKNAFPTLQVYGNTDRAELRLITCGGVYNDATGHYNDNIVVFAHLTGSRAA